MGILKRIAFELMYSLRGFVRSVLVWLSYWVMFGSLLLFGLMTLADYDNAWTYLILFPVGFGLWNLAWFYDVVLLKLAPNNMTLTLVG